ncbi:MAG: thioredoxin family protein [Parasphingorhabdus sp.]
MNMRMLAVSLAAITSLTACSGADDAVATNDTNAEAMTEVAADEAAQVKTAAVLVYADWCGSCKALDPKVKEVQARGEMAGLEFVTLDYTNRDEADFYAQAKAAGVDEAVKAHLDGTIKTGHLLLVDLDDQKVLSTVTRTFEPDQIATALKDAIEAS